MGRIRAEVHRHSTDTVQILRGSRRIEHPLRSAASVRRCERGLRLFPTASRLRFEARSYCASVQHANHSATKPADYDLFAIITVGSFLRKRERYNYHSTLQSLIKKLKVGRVGNFAGYWIRLPGHYFPAGSGYLKYQVVKYYVTRECASCGIL